MVDIATARRLAQALPEAVDSSGDDRLVFEVGGKGFAWSFLQRAAPKAPRHPDLTILALRCAMAAKEMLIEAAPDRFFDDDHYKGYPAVLVRLAAIDEAELAALLQAAWRIKAPKALLKRIDGA